MSDELTPVAPTEDMKLPPGSAVFQIINAPSEDGTPNLDLRGVLIGDGNGPAAYDPLNPAHRILAVINNRIDELVLEATGGTVDRTPAADIESKLADQQGYSSAEQQRLDEADREGLDPVSLSRGTPTQPMQHELADRQEGKGGSGLHTDD